MSLVAGVRLGPYEILGPLGAGGMGEVYRARDTRLGRVVAIKIIAPHLLHDERARVRFEREARAIAALSHPHICTLHDVGSAAGVEFLVMEHLEGETLAARLARQGSHKPLSLDETMLIATQLADALAAAHRAGIVHRDLKPANVMLARTGGARQGAPQVKVLDFGIAKLRAEPSDGTASRAATETAPVTDQATLVGTVPYMAPEQLIGREVDERTDVYALGTIIYEMTSGRRAFSTDSQASLIAAILDRDPEPLVSVQPLTPPGLDRLVRKCLAKDPEARWQNANDVADELRWIAAGSGSGSTAPPVRTPRRRSRYVSIAAGLLLAVGAVAAIWMWRHSMRPDAPEVQHRQVTFAGNVVAAAISPDGRSVVYGAGEWNNEVRVLVLDLAGGQTQPIWTGKRVYAVAWVSDGSQVLVSGVQNGGDGEAGTWILPRLGGSGRQLVKGAGPAASSPDGKSLAITDASSTGFSVISPEHPAGRYVKMTGFRYSVALDWHTRTNRIVLLTLDDDAVSGIWSVAPDGQAQTRLHASKEPIRAICSSPVSDVVYALRERSGANDLMRISMGSGPVSTRILLSGLPVTVAGETVMNRCTVSADGRRLAYTRATQQANLWRLDLARVSEVTRLTEGTLLFAFPKLSPDGQSIAARKGPDSDRELVKIPIRGGQPVSLGEGTGPAWSPDGQRLAFISRRSGSQRVWVVRADSVWPEEVKDSAVGNELLTWLPDGRLAWPTPGSRNYRIRDLRTGRDEYLVKDNSSGFVFQPRFSPRGDKVALFWNRESTMGSEPGLWLLSWPGREERRLTLGMILPIGWSPDSEWIYASALTGRSVVRVSTRTGKTEPVGEFPVGTLQDNFCDLAPEGAAIICGLTEQKADAWIMENFDNDIR